jgi:hypothetical protein
MAILKVLDDTKGAGQCRSCRAPIWWYELVSGKKHPFNGPGEPVYLKTEHDASHRLVGHLDSQDSHFATCPDSKGWSRKK